MASISVTYTFSNSTTADATQVNQNFTDIINGTSDGTKDFSISALTCAGNVTFNANTTIGNASSDDLTITASLASSIAIKTTNTYDIGSSTKGLRYIYFGDTADSNTHRLGGQSLSSDVNITLPSRSGTLALNDAPTITRYTSGSGTHTTASGCRVMRIIALGGGGGGRGSGTTVGTAATAGGNTTFGSSLITAAGGNGASNAGSNAIPGSVSSAGTINSPATTIANILGSSGVSGADNGSTGIALYGGAGGASHLGGAPRGGLQSSGGPSGTANTGAGGGGAGTGSTANSVSGGGGGGGNTVIAIIVGPTTSYSYSVGAGGTAATAGTSGSAGGDGGSGLIIVEEYF